MGKCLFNSKIVQRAAWKRGIKHPGGSIVSLDDFVDTKFANKLLEFLGFDALTNPPSGEGIRQGACLEFVKDGDGKQGGFTCGTTVTQQGKTLRPGGDMQHFDTENAASTGRVCRKGLIRTRISAFDSTLCVSVRERHNEGLSRRSI